MLAPSMISLFSETLIRNEGSRHTDAFKLPNRCLNKRSTQAAVWKRVLIVSLSAPLPHQGLQRLARNARRNA